MTNKNEQTVLLELGDRVVKKALAAGATAAEAVTSSGAHLSLKVRRQERELVEEAGSRSLGLRVMLGQQVAVTHTSDVSDAGIEQLVDDALELVRLSEPDEFAGAPDPSTLHQGDLPDLSLVDPAILQVDAQVALDWAMTGEQAAFDADPRITNSEGASASRVAGTSALVTSGGFRGGQGGTYVSLVVKPVADDAGGKKRSGYHWTARRHLAEIDDPTQVGEEAARRTLRKLGAKKVDSQELPVIFEPDAGRSILGLLGGCVLGNAIWRRSSYLAERIGSRVASDCVTVVDDPLIPKAPGSRAFDGEGLLSRKNVIVDNGILKTYLLDSYCGRKLGRESTASASRGSSGGVGPSTSNLHLIPGTSTQEELIADTKAGLFVTEMMGFGFNAVTGDFSRGAAGFWIEGGELTYPVSEVTISLNLDQLLQRIDAVANDQDMRTATVTPSFRVSAMTVAGR